MGTTRGVATAATDVDVVVEEAEVGSHASMERAPCAALITKRSDTYDLLGASSIGKEQRAARVPVARLRA